MILEHVTAFLLLLQCPLRNLIWNCLITTKQLYEKMPMPKKKKTNKKNKKTKKKTKKKKNKKKQKKTDVCFI